MSPIRIRRKNANGKNGKDEDVMNDYNEKKRENIYLRFSEIRRKEERKKKKH